MLWNVNINLGGFKLTKYKMNHVLYARRKKLHIACSNLRRNTILYSRLSHECIKFDIIINLLQSYIIGLKVFTVKH